MEPPKPKKKVIQVTHHGHAWQVYPLKCRDKVVFRVFHRVNGERRAKNFTTLAKAKADARSILKEIYKQGRSAIHLTDDEKRDWHAAVTVLQQSGIRSSFETIIRHYADLAATAGGEELLTDIVRKQVAARKRALTPIKLADLRATYLAALKKKERSERCIDAQGSHTGQFTNHVGDVMSDKITRERLQDFIDGKKGVDARTKRNLLEAIKAMMKFGKSHRSVPADWDEADHVVMPAVRSKKVSTFTAEELKKLFASAPAKFRPILALAAFAGIRSSEIEALE
ncbi:MAG: hypothetical protein IH623_22530 [Verrucomicrobia bacterium]|nr:hypothetical protein [Verrucomicrobiota bacterium]